MRALVIPADDDQKIREVDLPEGSQLDALQAIVGGLIQALPYPGRDDVTVYVNEEGKFDEESFPFNHRATTVMRSVLFPGDYIAGALVVCGFAPRLGEHTDLPDDVSLAAAALRP